MSTRADPAVEPYFSCRNVHSYYGESYIVQGISFDINKSEVVALLDATAPARLDLAHHRPCPRTAYRGWRTLARRPALAQDEILPGRSAGVQLVPEDRRIIPGITVEENLIIAQIAEPRGWELERIYHRFPRLAERRRQEAVTLSGGEQQMLAIARAVARDLKLLLLDEPYEGLAPQIVREIEGIAARSNSLASPPSSSSRTRGRPGIGGQRHHSRHGRNRVPRHRP